MVLRPHHSDWEAEFPLRPERREWYEACVARGRAEMAGRRAVLCGLARDLTSILPATIVRMERLGRLFRDYRVVVYENDSADGTCAGLLAWSRANPRVTILSERKGDPVNLPVRCLERARRMAYYRNIYRERVAQSCADFDVAIVVDMDLQCGWSYDGVSHTFGCPDWDFVGSYGVQKRHRWLASEITQYDAWAFRPHGSYAPLSTQEVNFTRWRRGDPLLPVFSCFGGLGIYRMEAMLRCRYDGGDCEHVALHRNMREAGFDRLFLNPNQLTCYGEKFGRIRRTLRRAVFRRATTVDEAWRHQGIGGAALLR
jgi:hypothetical protein